MAIYLGVRDPERQPTHCWLATTSTGHGHRYMEVAGT
jgi:hypothetical protein